jgi:hypothetical protein
MGHLSLKRLCGGGLRGAPSLGTLKDMLRKSPDTGISLHGDLFPSEGNLVSGGSLCEGFHEGDLGGELLYWGTRKMFLIDMQNTVPAGLPLHRGPVGELGGGSIAETFERKVYLCSFLGPGGH